MRRWRIDAGLHAFRDRLLFITRPMSAIERTMASASGEVSTSRTKLPSIFKKSTSSERR